jgi:hypothetical protein
MTKLIIVKSLDKMLLNNYICIITNLKKREKSRF